MMLVSCNSSKNDEFEMLFPETVNLKFVSLEFNELTFKPGTIEVFDSLLLVYDPDEKRNYVIFNINTHEIELEGGTIGQGPHDLIGAARIDKIDSDKFQVLDVTNRKTLIFSISDILNNSKFIPLEVILYSDFTDYSGNNPFFIYKYNDTINIGLGVFKEGKYVKYENKTQEYFLDYPGSKKSKINPYNIHQGVLHIYKSKNYILYHSPFGIYYELLTFDKAGKIVSIFNEYYPLLYNEISGDLWLSDESQCGINGVDFANEEIFYLYSGRTMKEYPKNAYYCNKIFVTDYKGTKKRLCHLDRDVSMISLDENKRRIYASSINPETFELEIGYFEY